MTKLLSIIIPTYNMQKYLRHCLDSLLVSDEMMDQLEVLVINDGSKDNSSKIAHEYETKYPNTFRVVDKENGNYGSCVNRGLKEVIGKYVKVLDADDSFDTKVLDDFIRFLDCVDVDLIITPYSIVNDAGRVRESVVYGLQEKSILTWEQLTPAFKHKSLSMHAVTYKRQNLIDINYHQSERISYTDQEWIFTPLTTVNTAVAYPQPLYKYLVGRVGQTVSPEIIKRNISHNEQCCRKIVLEYKAFRKFDKAKQEYIDYRFLGTITAMYNWYLVLYPDLDMRQLVLFDDFLKSVDASYLDLLDKQRLRYTPVRYIKRWHRNRQKRLTICAMYHKYAQIMNRISRWYAR